MRLNDPPIRSPLFDVNKLSPQLQQALLNLTRTWQQWLIQVPVTANAGQDLALLGATADETARGALQQQALAEALFAVVQPAVQQQVQEQLEALALERTAQALPDSEARVLAVAAGQSDRLIPDQLAALPLEGSPAPVAPSDLLAAVFTRNERSDFRAFVLEDTHGNRANYPAGAFELGQLFWETDRTALYIVQLVASVKQWVYVAGIYSDTLANIPIGLTLNDVGFRFAVTDYSHELRWTGLAWLFAPGDDSAYMAFGKPDGSAPNGGVWGLCNGATYTVLKSDGTTENLVTYDFTGNTFLRGGTPAGVLPAVALKWGVDKTDLANTGASVSTTSASVNAGAGAPATFLTSATFNEGSHQHGLSDANAPMQVPNETNGGLPQRANVAVYLRR